MCTLIIFLHFDYMWLWYCDSVRMWGSGRGGGGDDDDVDDDFMLYDG